MSGVTVRLTSGTAERDGTELALNHSYTFARTKSKIITYTGCALEISGEAEDYVAQYATPEESPALAHLNLHLALQAQRKEEARGHHDRKGGGGGGGGPRVMICGPQNTGKTTLARTLVALATRMGEQPLMANVDPREGLLALPGTVSAAVFGTVMDVEEPAGGFGVSSTPSSGPSLVPVKLPMVYYFGREKVDEDMPLWKDLVVKLGSSVRAKFSNDEVVRSAGLVLDTPPVTPGKGQIEILTHVVREFAGKLSKRPVSSNWGCMLNETGSERGRCPGLCWAERGNAAPLGERKDCLRGAHHSSFPGQIRRRCGARQGFHEVHP